jgi:hypothetical protein
VKGVVNLKSGKVLENKLVHLGSMKAVVQSIGEPNFGYNSKADINDIAISISIN